MSTKFRKTKPTEIENSVHHEQLDDDRMAPPIIDFGP